MKKFICQPLGGLNDILSNIGFCIEYCRNHNRKLIIDTRQFSDMERDFSDYFTKKNTDEDFVQLSLSDTERILLEEQYSISLTDVSDRRNKPVEIPLDLSTDYESEIILNRTYTGDISGSVVTLKFFKLQLNLAKSIEYKLSLMPDEYFSTYVRNTDYRTDYKSLFNSIKSEVGDRYLLVCTDDYRVIDFAKDIFPKLIFNEDIIKNPIPTMSLMNRQHTKLNKDKVNTNAITDLILGASSMQIFPSFVFSYSLPIPKNFQSGFVRLGIYLNQNKSIINDLLHL